MHMGCFSQADESFVSTFLAYDKGCTSKQPLKLSHGKTNPWLVNESPQPLKLSHGKTNPWLVNESPQPLKLSHGKINPWLVNESPR
jgi:hypothetical protein